MHQTLGIEEAHPHQIRRFISKGQANIRIKMQPKSLSLKVPLSWEINKIKCILSSTLPKIQFNMISLTHDNQVIPGHLTLQQVFDLDDHFQCNSSTQYVLTFRKNQKQLLQFQKFYANKMLPVLRSLKNSPYQPILHPKYYALQTQIVEISEMSGQSIKTNLQNLLNLRNLLNNINRNGAPQQQEAARPQNQQNADNVAGVGGIFGAGNIMGQQGNNRNALEWIMFLIFKVFQVMILWQLLQVIITYINKWHVLVIALIAVFYLYIDYYQKHKNQQPQHPQEQQLHQNQQNRQNQQDLNEDSKAQNIDQNEKQTTFENNLPQEMNSNQRTLKQNQGQQKQIYRHRETQENTEQNLKPEKDLPSQKQNKQKINRLLVSVLKNMCLLVEALIGFLMSLFPNWNIQLHHNLLRRPFDIVDSIVDSWYEVKEHQGFSQKKQKNE